MSEAWEREDTPYQAEVHEPIEEPWNGNPDELPGEPPKPAVGEELVNGRVCVAWRLLGAKRPSWAGDVYCVLALTGHGGDVYAVWNYVAAEPGLGEPLCYQGDYFSDFPRAVEEFWRREPPV